MDLTTLATRNYTYLPNGLVSQITETANSQTRTAKRAYDSLDRLISYQDLTGASISYTIQYLLRSGSAHEQSEKPLATKPS